MRRIPDLLILVLAVAAVGILVLLFQAAVSGGIGAPLAQATGQPRYPAPGTPAPTQPGLPPGYPPPPSSLPTLPPTEQAAIEATRYAEATATTARIMADATASAPVTFTPLPSGQLCYVDLLNRFSLWLPAGWHSDPPPSPDAIAGVSIFTNYDPAQVEAGTPLPLNPLKIQITSDELSETETLEQWVNELIKRNTSPTDEPARIEATLPSSCELGEYKGLCFTLSDSDFSNYVYVLQVSSRRLLVIGLIPAESTIAADGLSILSTLDASDSTPCGGLASP